MYGYDSYATVLAGSFWTIVLVSGVFWGFASLICASCKNSADKFWWFILGLLLGLIGFIITCCCAKDKDKDKNKNNSELQSNSTSFQIDDNDDVKMQQLKYYKSLLNSGKIDKAEYDKRVAEVLE